MRGIQINNYFNNTISLSGKKLNNNKSSKNVHQTQRQQPLVIDHIHDRDSLEKQQVVMDRLGNQVQFFKKNLNSKDLGGYQHQNDDHIRSPQGKSSQYTTRRKRRANTAQEAKRNPDKKYSKPQGLNLEEKFNSSLQCLKRERYSGHKRSKSHQGNDFEQNDQTDDLSEKAFRMAAKNHEGKRKAPKQAANHKQRQRGVSQTGVKRSKSAIIKQSSHMLQQNNYRTIDTSRQLMKHQKKNTTNSSNQTSGNLGVKKSSSKKLLSSKKQMASENESKTKQKNVKNIFTTGIKGSVGAKMNSQKGKNNNQSKSIKQDQMVADLMNFDYSESRRNKFQTERKSARTAGTMTGVKSYLTSAKQSKPVSARDKRVKKQLFLENSKQKNAQRFVLENSEKLIERIKNLKNQEAHESQAQGDQQEIHEALEQVQKALDNVQSDRNIAEYLKKIESKLKSISKSNYQRDAHEDQSEVINKMRRADKKTDEPKQMRKSRSHSKSKEVKGLKLKKQSKSKAFSTSKGKAQKKTKRKGKKFFKNDEALNDENPKPSPFDYEESEQSEYTPTPKKPQQQFSEQNDSQQKVENELLPQSPITKLPKKEESEVLDSNNTKYMEFLKSLEKQDRQNEIGISQQNESQPEESTTQFEQIVLEGQAKKDLEQQESQFDLSHFLNHEHNQGQFKSSDVQISDTRNYESQKTPQVNSGKVCADTVFNNPILQRTRNENIVETVLNLQKNHNRAVSGNVGIQGDQAREEQFDSQDEREERINEIEDLKEFRKLSDKLMKTLPKKKPVLDLPMDDQGQTLKSTKARSPLSLSSPKNPVAFEDHYPMMPPKSPKFPPELQISNILSAKEKFLSSKHEKMSELVQRMYERQLVSPKSYEFSMYQLRKQYQEETDGLDGFKEQASEILKEIRQDRQEIQGIDDLLRQERWEEAKKLMEHSVAEKGVKGFRKDRSKKIHIEEQVQNKEEVSNSERDISGNELKSISGDISQSFQRSPSKQNNSFVEKNVSIQIEPTPSNKRQESEQKTDQKQPSNQAINHALETGQQTDKKLPELQPRPVSRHRSTQPSSGLMSLDALNEDQHSFEGVDSNLESESKDDITKKLDFEFEQKYHLKSSDSQYLNLRDQNSDHLQRLKQEADRYLDVERASSVNDFQNYVYYEGEDSDNHELMDNQSGLSARPKDGTNSGELEEERGLQSEDGILKLIPIQETRQKSQASSRSHTDEDLLPNTNAESEGGQIEIITNNHAGKSQQPQREASQAHAVPGKTIDIVIENNEDEPKQELMQVPQIQSPINLDSSGNFERGEADKCLQDEFESDSVIELSLRKGFESNLFFIKEYCIAICEYIRDNEALQTQFKENISQPLQFYLPELLKEYRKTTEGNYDNSYSSLQTDLNYYRTFRQTPKGKAAISEEVAHEFNQTYAPLKFYNVDVTEKGKERFTKDKEAEKTFLRSILQVLNESLDIERPGSIFGKSLPWANDSKHLKNLKYKLSLENHSSESKSDQDESSSPQSYDFIFGVAIARIIQWGSCLCGFLPDTAELQNTEIDEDYVTHIRETRMAFLLQKMLADEQAHINNAELEETQVEFLVSKRISDWLLEELAGEMKEISEKRLEPSES